MRQGTLRGSMGRSLRLAAAWVGFVVAAGLLAGCASPSGLDPASVHATADAAVAGPWPHGQLWLTWTGGCGFCGTTPEGSRFTITAVYADGAALLVQAGVNFTQSGSSDLDLRSDDARLLAPELRELRDRVDSFYTRDGSGNVRGMAVFAVVTGTVNDWDLVGPQFQAWLDGARSTHHSLDSVTDCGPGIIASYLPPVGSGEVGCNRSGGAGWPELAQALGSVGHDLTPAGSR